MDHLTETALVSGTVDGIAEVAGNYPSAGGGGERAAWFRDSEGNLLGIGQTIPRPRRARD